MLPAAEDAVPEAAIHGGRLATKVRIPLPGLQYACCEVTLRWMSGWVVVGLHVHGQSVLGRAASCS